MSRKSSDVYYKINGTILTETEKAVRFKIKGISDKIWAEHNFITEWFPLSQVKSLTRVNLDSTSDLNNSEMDSMEVRDWILRSKGLS